MKTNIGVILFFLSLLLFSFLNKNKYNDIFGRDFQKDIVTIIEAEKKYLIHSEVRDLDTTIGPSKEFRFRLIKPSREYYSYTATEFGYLSVYGMKNTDYAILILDNGETYYKFSFDEKGRYSRIDYSSSYSTGFFELEYDNDRYKIIESSDQEIIDKPYFEINQQIEMLSVFMLWH